MSTSTTDKTVAPAEAHLSRVLGPLHLWALAVGLVISGNYFGWSYGMESGGPMGLLIALIPVLMIAGGGLVRLASPFLARADYRVRLAAQVWQEEQGKITEPTDETEAFAKRGVPRTDAYVAALDVHRRYATGSWFLGGWLGLVLGLRLVSGSVRRHRSIYQINQSACVVCGRCYNYCPLDHERALSLRDAPQEDQS